MPRRKASRYSEKRALGLVPHTYDKHTKAFQDGVQPPHPKVVMPKRVCHPRKGRHCFVAN